MLAEYSDEEIEVVLAHELAHHVHGDIWKGIVFESALILAGFYLGVAAAAGAGGVRSACAASPISRACRCCCSRPARVSLVMVPVGARDVARASSGAPIASRST